MHRSLPRRAFAYALLPLLLGGIASASSATAAVADDSDSRQVITYTGTQISTTTWVDPPSDTSGDGPRETERTLQVVCEDGDCRLIGWSTLHQTGGFPIVDGRVSFAGDASGSSCGEGAYIGAEIIEATVTAAQVSLTSQLIGSGSEQCSDTSSAQTGGYDTTLEADYVDGAVCALDDSCPLTAAVGVAAGVAGAGDGSEFGVTRGPFTIDTPSTLSELPTAAAALTPPNIIWAVAMTIVLVLLVAFPTHLLNSAAETGTDRFSEWWRSRRRTPVADEADRAARTGEIPLIPRPSRAVRLAGWPLAAVGVIVASVISSFASPDFGVNVGSVRVLASILVSFLLDVVVGWFALIWLVRRTHPSVTASFRFAPASLLIVIGAVVFSRVTGFEPGIVFGLVAGVAFGAILATAEQARVALIGIGYSAAVGVIGWIGYSVIAATAGSDPGAAVVFVQETLASMAIGGLAALPISLFPLRGMTGYAVFSWNRVAWIIAYALGLVGFFVVLMPMPFSWAGVQLSIWVWVGIYLAYALAAVGIWLAVTTPWAKESSGPDDSVPDEMSPAEHDDSPRVESTH